MGAYVPRCLCGAPLSTTGKPPFCCKRREAIETRKLYTFVRYGAAINSSNDEDAILEQCAEWFCGHDHFVPYKAFYVEERVWNPTGGLRGDGAWDLTDRAPMIFHGPALPSREFANHVRCSQVAAP